MDKFARQALAEGITSRDDIVVTVDSEIFRTLNQHYNRNNHVQPPENLVHVVQESLREFFDAIRLGKDSEPSWKKQIYKIINRLDDPIPEYFKDPNFLERLE
ncbi:hypothetical protein NECAME_07739 [Necator americanus]|nr:hypothetical protein NECAME_07739 [Necator americanus]ETN82845.1 hypothetical protein NECAME_07739 [Necator americanus]